MATRIPTPEMRMRKLKDQAEHDYQKTQEKLPLVATPTTVPADSRGLASPEKADEATRVWLESGAAVAVPRIQFDGKAGIYQFNDGAAIADSVEFCAFTNEIVVGYRKYGGEGVPTEHITGMPSRGFVMTARENLPDRDEATWSVGKFSGELEDPWKEIAELPLLRRDTAELFCFISHSMSGISAIKTLRAQQNWTQQMYPNSVPIVRLGLGKPGKKYGNPRPIFIRVGQVPRDNLFGTDTPKMIDLKTDLDDDLPDFTK